MSEDHKSDICSIFECAEVEYGVIYPEGPLTRVDWCEAVNRYAARLQVLTCADGAWNASGFATIPWAYLIRRGPNDEDLLVVTTGSMYLMSDDGKTIERVR